MLTARGAWVAQDIEFKDTSIEVQRITQAPTAAATGIGYDSGAAAATAATAAAVAAASGATVRQQRPKRAVRTKATTLYITVSSTTTISQLKGQVCVLCTPARVT